MADQCPNKNDIQLVFKRLRSIATNKVCFDCNAKNPTWASVTYGVFICIDCSAVHRSLGVHVTFVRSTQLDTNWTWLQLRQMQLGGNANGMTFFRQHNCTTTDAQQKYNSRAAQLYREKLHQIAIQAMRLHGTKLELGSRPEVALPSALAFSRRKGKPSASALHVIQEVGPHREHWQPVELHLEPNSEPAPSLEKKEEDFFSEHTSFHAELQGGDIEEDAGIFHNSKLGSLVQPAMANGAAILGRGEPSVDAAFSSSVDPSQDSVRKPTIGGRKPQAKRAGLGTKKGGLGAQKVKTNFAEIEREAAMADQLKVQAAEEAKLFAERSAEEEQKQMASMRLAYQDLSLQQKKEEEKLKQVDPKKAQQIERLGMGFANRTGVSHSALSDMKVIEQESPSNIGGSSSKSVFDRDNDGFFDDFHFSSAGFGMYKSSSAGERENKSVESIFLDSKGWTSLEPESRQPSGLSSYGSEERSTHRRDPTPSLASAASGNEAQKKFGSAKAISSDQYFGDSSDNNWERKANLSRFEGSSSISSADYFGNSTGVSSRGGGSGGLSSQLQTPDLEDVKESVRQGVTKVAGKLSSIANGVMSSIQDRYGY